MSATTADAGAIAAAPTSARVASGASAPLRWDGGSGRLVAIGLGNLVLAVLTLGVYRFWGTVRLRRHLWAHQEFLGGRLEYSGTGGELFRGFLLALLVLLPVLLAISLAETLLAAFPAAAGALVVAKLAALTYLVGVGAHAARRYIASRTLWRGLRFQVDGSPWRFGAVSLRWAALTLLTLGLAHPWSVAAKERWSLGKLHLGTAPVAFDGTARGLRRVWFAVWLLVPVGALALWLLLGSAAASRLAANLPGGVDAGTADAARMGVHAAVAASCALPVLLLGWVSWSAAAMRWRAGHTVLGGARFSMPGATGWAVFRLLLGNLLLSLLSLGLLHPVAMARNAAFHARHLRLDRAPDLSAARQAERGPGTGEGVADLLGAGAF